MSFLSPLFLFFFFNDTATTEIYTLSLHDALPICGEVDEHQDGRIAKQLHVPAHARAHGRRGRQRQRSEEHTSELQSPDHLVCRLLLEKKKKRSQQPDDTVRRRMKTSDRAIQPYYT